MRRDCISIGNKRYATFDKWTSDTNQNMYGLFTDIHLFDGTIQRKDKYGHNLYLKKVTGSEEWEVTTEVTSTPYNYPNLNVDYDDIYNVFLQEYEDAFCYVPYDQYGKDKEEIQSTSYGKLFANIGVFAMKNEYKYLGLLDTMFQDYDPITNYDSYEKRDDTHGDETFTHTPKVDDVEGHTKTTVKPTETATETTPNPTGIETEHYVTTYDSDSSTRLSDRTVQKGGTTTTVKAVDGGDGVNETTFSSEKYQDKKTQSNDGYVLRRKGNIGVTTSQQMIESERQLRKFSVLKIFCDDLAQYITLGIY